MKRVAIYARTAVYVPLALRTPLPFDNSIEAQLEHCRVYATEQGYDVILEASGSGRKPQAGLQQVMELAQQHKIDILLCTSMDRISRDYVETLAVTERLKSLGVNIECARLPGTGVGRG